MVLVAVGALAAIAYGSTSSNTPAAPSAPSAAISATGSTGKAQPPQPGLARRLPGDPLALGKTDAPVVLIEWAEFQCPFCGRFARDTQPALIDKYVRSGTLRIEWRDFPYLGPESTTAALAARAAAAQGKFWPYHDALFAHQFPPNSGHLTDAYLVGIAKTLGLNIARFQVDMNSPATKQAVEKDFLQGQNLGVTGTPSFLVNSTPIVGAQPLSVFENAIEQAAAQAK